MRVAVYGTLRRGERNHFALSPLDGEAPTRFLGTAHLSEAWELWDLGSYPAAVIRPGRRGARVLVEVFDVSRGVLRALDLLEGHPDLYQRKRASVRVGGSPPLSVSVYAMPQGRLPAYARPIPSGDWLKRGA